LDAYVRCGCGGGGGGGGGERGGGGGGRGGGGGGGGGNRSSVNSIKCETAVKINYKYTCKDFYTSMLKDEDILEAAQSNKQYILNPNIEPKLIKLKILFLIIYKT
jgi:hypothetical protein